LPYLSSTRKTRNYRNNKQRKFENYPAANLVYGILIGNVFGPMNGYTFLSGLDSRFRVRLVRKIKLES
jgi:lysyl-tRNA synthetase class I